MAVEGDFAALRIEVRNVDDVPAPVACFRGSLTVGRPVRLFAHARTGNHLADTFLQMFKKGREMIDLRKVGNDGRVDGVTDRMVRHNCNVPSQAEGGPLVDLMTGYFIGMHTFSISEGVRLSMLVDTPLADKADVEFFDVRSRSQSA